MTLPKHYAKGVFVVVVVILYGAPSFPDLGCHSRQRKSGEGSASAQPWKEPPRPRNVISIFLAEPLD
jgi:hypothetical protein